MNRLSLGQLYPFYFEVDKSLRIISAGRSITKLIPGITGMNFDKVFRFDRPGKINLDFDELTRNQNLLIILKSIDDQLILRGQMIQEGDSLIFYISIWIRTLEEMRNLNLSVADFAPQDPILDLLQVINFHEISIQDLTTQTRSLKKAKIQLEKALNAKQEFLSVMTHEIRTPLNAIMGMANILNEENQVPEFNDHLNILSFSANNLLNLVNDILDYSKIESGTLEIEDRPYNLRVLLGQVYETMFEKAREQQLAFLLEMDPELPAIIMGDPTRMGQVLFNLINNGIKFTPKGEIRVKVRVVARENQVVRIRYSVIDTGIGIPEDKMAEIFKSFTQGTSSLDREFDGSGLGLSITARLLSMMGSQIRVCSELGKGSEFYFDMDQVLTDETDNPEVWAGSESLKGFNILLAEDNKINVKIVVRHLKKWGLSFDVAANGEEAVELVKINNYDLVLMDLLMPRKDGYQATREIKAEHPHLPVLALSASLFEEVENKIKEAGMDGFVGKPFRAEKLYNVLSGFLFNIRKSRFQVVHD